MATSIGKQNQDGGHRGSGKASQGMDPDRFNNLKKEDDTNPGIPGEVPENIPPEKERELPDEMNIHSEKPEVGKNDKPEIIPGEDDD